MYPMRILYVITKGSRGGAQTNVLALAKAAQAAGHQVTVATGEGGWLALELRRANISVRLLRSLRRSWNPWRAFSYLFEIRREVIAGQAEVVHCHSSNTLPTAWAMLGLPRRPLTVFTVHGWSALHPGWAGPALARRLYALTIRACLPRFDRIIVVCRHDYEMAIRLRLAPPEKVTVIRNGIDLGREFNPADEARRALLKSAEQSDRGQVIIGTIARLEQSKRLDLLVEAARHVPNERLLYVIGGDGPDRRQLERLIERHGLTEHVKLIGPIFDAAELLKGFDLFVMTSRYEGLPYALLEAGLAERPVVAVPVGGVPEIIEHDRTGRLLRSETAQALAEEISRFLADRHGAGQRAHNLGQRVRSVFSLKTMVDLTLNLYA